MANPNLVVGFLREYIRHVCSSTISDELLTKFLRDNKALDLLAWLQQSERISVIDGDLWKIVDTQPHRAGSDISITGPKHPPAPTPESFELDDYSSWLPKQDELQQTISQIDDLVQRQTRFRFEHRSGIRNADYPPTRDFKDEFVPKIEAACNALGKLIPPIHLDQLAHLERGFAFLNNVTDEWDDLRTELGETAESDRLDAGDGDDDVKDAMRGQSLTNAENLALGLHEAAIAHVEKSKPTYREQWNWISENVSTEELPKSLAAWQKNVQRALRKTGRNVRAARQK